MQQHKQGPPSWRWMNSQARPCNAIFDISVPTHGLPSSGTPPRQAPHSPGMSLHSSISLRSQPLLPSQLPAFALCTALSTQHLQCPPASLCTCWAKGWLLASISMDWQAEPDFAPQKWHLFLFLSSSQLPVSWKLQKIVYPWTLTCSPHVGALCCVCQPHSLYADVNRARTRDVSSISCTSLTAWVPPAPTSPWKPSPSKHQDCRHQKGLTEASGSALQRWGMQHFQISRALSEHQQPDTTKHSAELSCTNTCSSDPVIFPRHRTNNYQGVGEL